MPTVYWKKKTLHLPIKDKIPYKGLCHEYGLACGIKTSNIAHTDNKIISGEETEILKRLLPNHDNAIDCIYYHFNISMFEKNEHEELKLILHLLNTLLSENGILLLLADEKLTDEPTLELITQSFSKDKIELKNLLNSLFINQKCTILQKFNGTINQVKDLLRLNKEDNGNRQFILLETTNLKKETVINEILNSIDDPNLQGLSLNYYSMGEPLFIGKDQELLNENIPVKQIREYVWFSETRTDYYSNTFSIDEPYLLGIKNDTAYYFFFEAEETTTLNSDTLSMIKTKAQKYIIYANNCLLPKEFLTQNNIQFKQIPKFIGRI